MGCVCGMCVCVTVESASGWQSNIDDDRVRCSPCVIGEFKGSRVITGTGGSRGKLVVRARWVVGGSSSVTVCQVIINASTVASLETSSA
jgi:hypothetical protein